MAGQTYTFGPGNYDFWLVRTDANGDSLWSRTFGGENDEHGSAFIQTADGGFVIAGGTRSFDAGGGDFWLVRTDANGDSLWSRTFGGEHHEGAHSLIQTADGGFVMAGQTYTFGPGNYDFWLVRTDANGDSLWSRTFGGGRDEYSFSLIQTADGGFALAGQTVSFGAGGSDFWLVRTDANGDSLWSCTFGGGDHEWGRSLIQTADGGFALAGYTQSFGAGEEDFWLVKTGPDPVYVPDADLFLHPLSFILSPAYPNPFNSTTTIRYDLPSPNHVSLQVYNLSGQRITTLFEGHNQVGMHTLNFDAGEMPSGLYFVKLYAGGQAFTQKVYLIR